MRILLFTGKGGVGKTTAAAGTAVAAAATGLRTLVMSTDPAHSLADAFGSPIGAEPASVAPCLTAQHVDAQRRFEQSWPEIRGYLLSILGAAGVDRIAAEELVVLPVAEEVLALLEVRTHARSGQWDLLVLDCAPTAETLRLLALPEALGWYLDRIFPMRNRLVKALTPVLTKTAGIPLPEEPVVNAVERLQGELLEVHRLLTGPDASVRLVLTPESVVVAEARRALTALSLFGYRVDGVVANRVFPSAGGDDWRGGWVTAQRRVLEQVEQSFAGLPVWRSPYLDREPVGTQQLLDLARATYGADEPWRDYGGPPSLSVLTTEVGATLCLALPFTSRAEVDLARHGDDIVVTVGSYRRLVALPAALRSYRVVGAAVDGGVLTIRFVPEALE
ncbi:MAG: ArsA family ATPase [Nocardioidaceae bacterium]